MLVKGKKKKNYLLECVKRIVRNAPRGKALDLGCGSGDYAYMLQEFGFDTVAADTYTDHFRYADAVPFMQFDACKSLPFAPETFDYVLFMEVVEHLYRPFDVIADIHRIVRKGGTLLLSTPNILNIRSRLRYLFEGAYDYFREPLIEQTRNEKEKNAANLHVIPWRYHELEYLLYKNGFAIEGIYTSRCEHYALSFLIPFILFQLKSKSLRSEKSGTISYRRIHDIIGKKEMLFGRHLVVQAKKE